MPAVDDVATLLDAADAAYAVERLGATEQLLGSAFKLLRASGDRQQAARVAIELACLCSTADRLPVARGWVERARTLLDAVGPCVEHGYLELAFMACERPDVDDLLASAERALAVAIEFGDAELEARAMADGGLALVCQGRLSDGFSRLDAALTAVVSGEVGERSGAICLCSMLTACDRAGDLQRAEQWSTLVREAVEPAGGVPRSLSTHCRMAYGSVLAATGRWSEAEALIVEALGPDDSPSVSHRALTSAHLASLRIAQGRLDEAAELLAPFEDQLVSCEPLARLHHLQGDAPLAAAVLERGLRALVGDVVRSAPLLALLVEVHLTRGDVTAAGAAAAALAQASAIADLPAVVAEAALAEARVAAAGGAIEAAAPAYRRAITALGTDRPHRSATAQLELAELLAGAGDAPAAIAEARAALACFRRLGAARDRDRATALLRGLGDRSGPRPAQDQDLSSSLSPRELEVLALIAGGLTNAGIAERLYISPKTAEHHVGRILSKLGLNRRAEAAALAVRLGVGEDSPIP